MISFNSVIVGLGLGAEYAIKEIKEFSPLLELSPRPAS